MNNKDQWNSLSDFLSNMIVKYADVLDIESLPSPVDISKNINTNDNTQKNNFSKIPEDIESKEKL